MISPSTIILLVLLFAGYHYVYKPYILNAPKPSEKPKEREPVNDQPQSKDEGEYIDYEEVD
ncbi:MAG: hypothetical protein AAFV80_13105 [Bacteroidota bacterium]